jgi:hypothetical protein
MATNKRPLNTERGFVALMATVVISVVLLILIVQMTLLAWSTRFMVLDRESSERTMHVAQSCAQQAALRVLVSSTYAGGTSTVGEYECVIARVLRHEPSRGLVTVYVQVREGRSQTILEVIYEMNDIYLELVPAVGVSGTSVTPEIVRTSWREIPKLPEM